MKKLFAAVVIVAAMAIMPSTSMAAPVPAKIAKELKVTPAMVKAASKITPTSVSKIRASSVSTAAYNLSCFYQDASPNWYRQGLYAINCIQRNGYWVNGSNPMILTGLGSDGDGQHTLFERMRYGQEYRTSSDWDPAHWISSTSILPDGVTVIIYR